MQVGEYLVSYLDPGDSIAIQTLTTPTATGRITFSVVGMNPTDPSNEFTLVPLPEWSPPPPEEPNRLVVRLLQPVTSWEWEAPSSDHRLLVGLNVIQSLLARTGPGFRPEARYLANGFLAWQIEQLSEEPDISHWWSGDWRPPVSADDTRWYPLADLWTASVWTERQQIYLPRRQVAAWLAEARLLVAYLIDHHGVEQIPIMLQALQRADSMDDWLLSAAGQRARTIEPIWRQWVIDHTPPESGATS